MGVYIKGMCMPCEEIEPMIFEVYADGTVYAYTDKKRVGDFLELKAVEVKEPHGRLGDLDALIVKHESAKRKDIRDWDFHARAQNWIIDAPTVIEAEDNDETDT